MRPCDGPRPGPGWPRPPGSSSAASSSSPGVLKVPDPAAAVRAVRAYQLLPEPLVAPVAFGLPVLEIAVGLALLLGVFVRTAAIASAVLLVVFLVARRLGVGARPADRLRLLRQRRPGRRGADRLSRSRSLRDVGAAARRPRARPLAGVPARPRRPPSPSDREEVLRCPLTPRRRSNRERTRRPGAPPRRPPGRAPSGGAGRCSAAWSRRSSSSSRWSSSIVVQTHRTSTSADRRRRRRTRSTGTVIVVGSADRAGHGRPVRGLPVPELQGVRGRDAAAPWPSSSPPAPCRRTTTAWRSSTRARTTQYSTRALNAAAAVVDAAGPDAFQTFHDLLFANQPAEGGVGAHRRPARRSTRPRPGRPAARSHADIQRPDLRRLGQEGRPTRRARTA